jgi:hypothetical protein
MSETRFGLIMPEGTGLLAYLDRVKTFNFSPCHVCGGCSLLEKNEEDCYGHVFPACGACLWAQGIIPCP